MAAKKPEKPKGIVMHRPRRQTTRFPIATVGYQHLVEPDDYQGKKTYKANFHYSPKAFEKLEKIIQSRTEELMPGFLKECEKKEWTPPTDQCDVSSWLSEKKVQVKESSKSEQREDFLQIGAKEIKGEDKKTGEPYTLGLPKAWDKDGNLLDIKKLSPAAGTVCIPIVEVGIFANREYTEPTPCIKLIGIQILKLERFNGAGIEAIGDDDIEGWEGDDIEAEDLSAFAGVGINDSEDDDDGDANTEDDIPV